MISAKSAGKEAHILSHNQLWTPIPRSLILVFTGVLALLLLRQKVTQGRIQDFVSCSTSTPINHIVFLFFRIPVVLENRRSGGGGGGCARPCNTPIVFKPGYLRSIKRKISSVIKVESVPVIKNNTRIVFKPGSLFFNYSRKRTAAHY